MSPVDEATWASVPGPPVRALDRLADRLADRFVDRNPRASACLTRKGGAGGLDPGFALWIAPRSRTK